MAAQTTFDFSDFEKRFRKVALTRIPELLEKGLGRAMLVLLGDCVMQVPTVPIKEGWLRGSGSVFVQGKLAGISTHGRPGRAAKSLGMPIKAGELLGVIGFNTPYAAKMHEGIGLNFSEPSAGPKYLESKLHRNRASYMAEVADTVKEGGDA